MKTFGSRWVGLWLGLFLLQSPLRGGEYLTAHLQGQTGNHFFQIAAACALAWDHGAEAFFPQLGGMPSEYRHYFSKFKVFPPSPAVSCEWIEPDFSYHPIPYQSGMKIVGYFQSWKYFEPYRDKLLSLFAPTSSDRQYIQKKYGALLAQPETVGIQLRYYFEDPYTYPQYGSDYFEQAMALFPQTATFIVSSNRIEFAKSQISTAGRQVIFLENEPDYIDFHLLTQCRHNIISNSTFGWWSAFLNQNPNQIVVCPADWSAFDTRDLCPGHWIRVSAERIDPALVK